MMKPIRLFSMFTGYGGAEFALKKAGIPYECVGYSEIDKNAIKCYEQNFPRTRNYGDATQINPDELPDFDLLTGGFPCQSFSSVGKRKGFEDTRGTLIFDVLRIAKAKRPKYMVLENVEGLINHDNGKTFDIIKTAIKQVGYDIVCKVLNSADFGVPQSRKRIWIVCKYGKWGFMEFIFPTRKSCDYKLMDLLQPEEEVDKKYYLNDAQIKTLLERDERKMGITMKCNDNKIQSLLFMESNNDNFKVATFRGDTGTVWRASPICPTLTKTAGLPSANSLCCKVIISSLFAPKRSGEWVDHRKIRENGPMFTLTTSGEHGIKIDNNNYRMLTPKESFRCMGFVNDEINLDGLSESAIYSLAGNGWEINVASLVMRNLFKPQTNPID